MHPQTISRAARAAFLPILIAGAASLAAPRAARAAEHALTLDEAIELALSHNEQIAIDRESFSAAKAGLTGARGAYDPLLQISGGWQRSREPLNSSFSGVPLGSAPTYKASEGTLSIRQLLPTGASLSIAGRAAHETTSGSLALLTPANSTQIGVELRQPLLRGFAIDPARANVRVARSQRSGAEAALRSTVTETIASVEQGYWSLIAARQAVDVLEESVRLAQEQLEETESRVKTGAAPETETAQPRAELQRRTGDLLAARENLSRAENALKVQILSDEDPLWADRLIPADEPTVDPSPVDVAALMDQALDRRPELRAGAAAIERRRAETSLARNSVYPSLDAVLSYDRYGLAGSRNPLDDGGDLPDRWSGGLGDAFQSLGDSDYDAVKVGLVLEVPISNRSARAAASSARSALDQAQADVSRMRKSIRAEVLDAAAALETARQRIEAARSGREAAEVQLSAEQDRYAVGLSTNFLVLTRQNDLSRARLEEISALTAYRNARTEIARATGSLLDERDIDGREIE